MTAGSLTNMYSNENTIFCLNPQITYFKSVFRKYTKFVMTDYRHTSVENGNNFGSGKDITFNFSATGDLLSKVSLQIELNGANLPATCNRFPHNIGTALFDNIQFKYDNSTAPIIEQLNSEYINFTSMLNNPKSFNSTYDIVNDPGNPSAGIPSVTELVCNNGNNYQRMALSGGVFNSGLDPDEIHTITKMKAIVPIPFSFTKNVGSAFPLFLLTKNGLSLQIHQSNDIDTGIFQSSIGTPTAKEDLTTILKQFHFSLIFKYIYLSEEEKNRFKSSSQEYLVEKVLFNSDQLRLVGSSVDFQAVAPNLPVKSIYLVNKSASGTEELYSDVKRRIPLHNNYKYKFLIRGVNMQLDDLPHEYYSKLNIIENFKGCVYDKWDYKLTNLKESSRDQTNPIRPTPSINSNIAYIPFNLKNTEGPSGCINTGTNDLQMSVTGTGAWETIIYIYLVYYSIMKVSDNQHLSFPYKI